MNNEQAAIDMVWHYMKLGHQIKKADAIIAFGSYDPSVGQRAAELFLEGYAPLLVFSGGQSDSTKEWDKSEADTFLDIALKKGIDREHILIENKSSNSGENIAFTKKLLAEEDKTVTTAIIVHKPFMERRVYATLQKQWPELDIMVTSPDLDFSYYENLLGYDRAVGDLVGDLERIKKYPELGFQIKQDIPDNVWNARCILRGLGYCIKQIDI